FSRSSRFEEGERSTLAEDRRTSGERPVRSTMPGAWGSVEGVRQLEADPVVVHAATRTGVGRDKRVSVLQAERQGGSEPRAGGDPRVPAQRGSTVVRRVLVEPPRMDGDGGALADGIAADEGEVLPAGLGCGQRTIHPLATAIVVEEERETVERDHGGG